jgi:predicted alpha/beta-hydrolase family hydrolase
VQHLPRLHVPALFVHGTRDPFGSVEEMEMALKMIPAKTQVLVVDGAGHDLGFKGKSMRDGLVGEVVATFAGFFQ